MDDKNLKKIEQKLIEKREWIHMGEVDANKRPHNSLLSKDQIDFDVTSVIQPISAKQNDEIKKMVLMRIREGTFDNIDFSIENKVLTREESDNLPKDDQDIDLIGLDGNILNVLDNTNGNDTDVDIVELYNEIESELMRISDFNNTGFIPDVKIKTKVKEERVVVKKPSVKDLGSMKNVTILK